MKVASIAHSILFIFVSFLFLFNSGFAFIDEAMINMLGEENFLEAQEAIVYAENFYGAAISSLFIIEIIVYTSICIVAITFTIKGFKKLMLKARFKSIVLLKEQIITSLNPTLALDNNEQGTYLVLGHLRN